MIKRRNLVVYVRTREFSKSDQKLKTIDSRDMWTVTRVTDLPTVDPPTQWVSDPDRVTREGSLEDGRLKTSFSPG